MDEHGGGRTVRGGEPGTASRVLLLLLGLLGFVLSPATAPPAAAGFGPAGPQQTVSLKKTPAHGVSRALRGGRGSAEADRSGSHAAAAPAVAAPSVPTAPSAHVVQGRAHAQAVLSAEVTPPVPVRITGRGVDGPTGAVAAALVGTPRGRAPPISTKP